MLQKLSQQKEAIDEGDKHVFHEQEARQNETT